VGPPVLEEPRIGVGRIGGETEGAAGNGNGSAGTGEGKSPEGESRAEAEPQPTASELVQGGRGPEGRRLRIDELPRE
jgi:hypothetical protein